jgi:hypothetical protein
LLEPRRIARHRTRSRVEDRLEPDGFGLGRWAAGVEGALDDALEIHAPDVEAHLPVRKALAAPPRQAE